MKKSKMQTPAKILTARDTDSEFAFRAFLAASLACLVALTIFAGFFAR